MVPLGPDALFVASASGVFPGFRGSLNYSGDMSGSMKIPKINELRGIEIYLAMAATHQARGDISQARAVAERGLLYCNGTRECDALRSYTR